MTGGGFSDFDAMPLLAPSAASDDSLILNVEGFEGPLDVLLALARTQKVDLSRLSILDLVEQYLGFIREARRLRLELAADYLVMAAWLAYLKSRLLLPREENNPEEPDAEELALRLQIRLQKLDAMREAGSLLMARGRFGRDVHGRGMPEQTVHYRRGAYGTTLYELLRCYGDLKLRTAITDLKIHRRPVYAIEDAVRRLESLIGAAMDWTRLKHFFPDEANDQALRKSAVASLFAASLELAKQGRLELRQAETFGPLYLRLRRARDDDHGTDD